MKERYLIDGYNLLFQIGESETLEKGRLKLLNILNEMVKRSGIDAIVIFDGAQEFKRTIFDSLDIIYTPQGMSADDYILEELEAKRKHTPIVVTNDKALGKNVKAQQAKLLSVSVFFKIISKKRPKPPKKKVETTLTSSTVKITIVDRELERWIRIFEERLKNKPEDLDV